MIPNNISGELIPVIEHREVPPIFKQTYRHGKHTLKYQYEDYETPRGVSINEVSLESQIGNISALKFTHGLCLLENRDDDGKKVETMKKNIIGGGTTKKD